MKKFFILIPVYNDWESLQKLLDEIDISLSNFKDFEFDCVVVNDASTINPPTIQKPQNIKSIKLISMSENRGHARCNAFGLKYIHENEKYDFLIVMDGDGEDRPVEIIKLVEQIKKEESFSVVAKRVKRSEGPVFQFLYRIHKYLTFLFTGEIINFGNYSCLIKRDVEKICTQASLWSSFSGSFKKHVKNYNTINSERGKRYFGPSKMSLINLIIHSFSIIAVFRKTVFFRSSLIAFLLIYLSISHNTLFYFFLLILILFNLLIFFASLRESKTKLENSTKNVKNINLITH